jgi:hypothetical protein
MMRDGQGKPASSFIFDTIMSQRGGASHLDSRVGVDGRRLFVPATDYLFLSVNNDTRSLLGINLCSPFGLIAFYWRWAPENFARTPPRVKKLESVTPMMEEKWEDKRENSNKMKADIMGRNR